MGTSRLIMTLNKHFSEFANIDLLQCMEFASVYELVVGFCTLLASASSREHFDISPMLWTHHRYQLMDIGNCHEWVCAVHLLCLRVWICACVWKCMCARARSAYSYIPTCRHTLTRSPSVGFVCPLSTHSLVREFSSEWEIPFWTSPPRLSFHFWKSKSTARQRVCWLSTPSDPVNWKKGFDTASSVTCCYTWVHWNAWKQKEDESGKLESSCNRCTLLYQMFWKKLFCSQRFFLAISRDLVPCTTGWRSALAAEHYRALPVLPLLGHVNRIHRPTCFRQWPYLYRIFSRETNALTVQWSPRFQRLHALKACDNPGPKAALPAFGVINGCSQTRGVSVCGVFANINVNCSHVASCKQTSVCFPPKYF